MLDRSQCGQHVFGGCYPATCQRRCFTARIYDLAARQQAEDAKQGRLIILSVTVFLAAILIGLITPQAVENIKAWEVANVPQ